MTKENNILKEFTKKFGRYIKKDHTDYFLLGIMQDWLSSALTQYKKEIMESEYKKGYQVGRAEMALEVMRIVRAKKMQKHRSQIGEIQEGRAHTLLEGGIQEDEDLLRTLTPPSPKEVEAGFTQLNYDGRNVVDKKKASPKDTEDQFVDTNKMIKEK